MDKSWFLNFLLNNKNLRSGYWLQPKNMVKDDYVTFHDFGIFNPRDKEIGKLSTSMYPSKPGVIRVDDVWGFPTDKSGEIVRLPGEKMWGGPGSLGFVPTRDLARQLHGYYSEIYPNVNFDRISGLRISGARANGPVPLTYAGVPLSIGETTTKFKPAIAGGTIGLGGAGALDDWNNAEDPRTYLNPFMPRS